MPRPSLKAERTTAILDAVERVVIRDGISGATLEKIAEEAKMRRSLLRHNIGNRDQLIAAFLERFFARSTQEMQQMITYLPTENRSAVLLNFLFDEKYSNSQLVLVALALTSAATNEPVIREQLKAWNKDYIDVVAEELALSYPDAPFQDRYEVATGVIGISFNSESLTPLGDMATIRQASKKAAARLLSTLEHPHE